MATALFLKPPTGIPGQSVVRDFVYGCWCNGKRVAGMQMPPLADLYVATHARQEGLRVALIDAQLEPERYRRLIGEGLPDVIAVVLLSSTQSFRRDVSTLREIKGARPGIRSVLFGSHPTFRPAACLREDAVDFVVMSEPEGTVRELLAALVRGGPVEGIAGLGFRSASGEARINPARPFMELDELPIPDRSLLPPGIDYFNPVVKRLPYTTVQTSRGCPGGCIFCTVPGFYGRRYRYRSAGKVLEELRLLRSMGYREIFFRDETFTALKERNREICEVMIREGLGLSWIANGRVDMVDPGMLRLMARAGCHMVKFGVESGSDALLRNYKKGTTCAQAEEAFAQARRAGLDTHAHIVLGGPGETPETIEETIRFSLKLDPTSVSFGILTPYPGAELFDMVAAKRPDIRDGTDSNMENLHVDGFFSRDICGLGGEFLSRAVTRAYRRFYMRPGYLLRRLMGIRSLSEFAVLTVAGANVLTFAATGRK